MKSDNHAKLHYWDYIKDMKFLLHSHVPQLQKQEPKDVKMIKTTVWDLKCKYLHPSESTEASSSDEGMPQKFDTPSEADIMAEFPKDILTPDMRSNISYIIEYIEASHTEAAEAMQCMKKLVMTIPVGAFCLMLQAMVQPHIMIQGWWLCCVRSGKEEKHCTASLVDMVPDGQLSENLPNPVRTLAAILHYQLKNETRIKLSIMATSKLFGTKEKLLHQALKGVHYESGSQKCRWENAAHDKQEDSSSSNKTDDKDDDDDEEGAVARIELLKKKHKKWCETTDEKWNMWHQSCLIITVFPLGPLHQPVPSCIPNFKIFLSRLLFHILNHPVKIKKPHEIQNSINFKLFSLSISKSGPLHHQKLNTKHHKMFSFEPKKPL